MKKGLVHLDWVISFFIFFMYLAFLFIFLRPVNFEDNNQEALLDIVELNFKNDAYWNISRVPVFFTCTGSCNLGEDICIELFPFNWNGNNARLLAGNTLTQFNFGGSSPEGSCGLAFNYQGNNLYWIEHMANENIGMNNWICSTAGCDNFISRSEYEYSYGLPQFVNGISARRLITLNSEDYNLLKTRYSFPSINEFEIEVRDNTGSVIMSYKKSLNNEGIGNAYVREFRDRLLNVDGSFSNVIVSIKVW